MKGKAIFMNMMKPPVFKAVETTYDLISTECVVTHSVDKMGVRATMREDLYESLKDTINILQHLINGIKISEEDTVYNHYRYKCSKLYFDEHGVQTARLDIKVLKNHPDAENCLYIEVNPNKSFHDERCLHDLETLLSMSELYCIEKLDIAIDIPISKAFVHLIKDKRAKLDYHASKDSKTEYLGKVRTNVGHVKLYDKRKECGLAYDLTRLEITVGNPLSEHWSQDVRERLPKVTILVPEGQGTNLSADLNDTERVLIELLRANPDKVDFWNQLGYKMKRKIEPYVFANDLGFAYDMEAIEEVASNAVKAVKFNGAYYMNQYIHP